MLIMEFAVFCVYLNLIRLDCKLFAMLGGICGTVSIFTMIMIGYDRYNVIVKGLSAKKITKMKVSQKYSEKYNIFLKHGGHKLFILK